MTSAVADPEEVQVVRLNPHFRQNYFINGEFSEN